MWAKTKYGYWLSEDYWDRITYPNTLETVAKRWFSERIRNILIDKFRKGEISFDCICDPLVAYEEVDFVRDGEDHG